MEIEKNFDYASLEQTTEDAAAEQDDLGRVVKLARLQFQAELEVAKKVEELEKAKKALDLIKDKLLPELCDKLKIPELKTSDGLKVEIQETIRAGIKEEHQTAAFTWLEEHNNGDLIKRQFIISFSRNQESWANKFEADLKKRKKPVPVDRKYSIHGATLAKFVREQLEEGVEIPLDVFGVFRQRFSKVTLIDSVPTEPKKRSRKS